MKQKESFLREFHKLISFDSHILMFIVDFYVVSFINKVILKH